MLTDSECVFLLCTLNKASFIFITRGLIPWLNLCNHRITISGKLRCQPITRFVAGVLEQRLRSANPSTNYVCHIIWVLSVTFLSLVLLALSNKGLFFPKRKGHHVFQATVFALDSNPTTRTSCTSTIVKASLTPTKKVLNSLLALLLKTGS